MIWFDIARVLIATAFFVWLAWYLLTEPRRERQRRRRELRAQTGAANKAVKEIAFAAQREMMRALMLGRRDDQRGKE